MTQKDMETAMAKLEEENKRMREQLAKGQQARALTFKVGDKGGVSVYGLNARFPITLYAEQWERLINVIPELQAFIVANKGKLTFKNGGADKAAA